MATQPPMPARNGLFILGLVLIIISTAIFCIPLFGAMQEDQLFSTFLAHFILTITYFITIWVKGAFRKNSGGITHAFLFLVLFLISAYALNRIIPVFELSVSWFSTLLVVLCINYIGLSFFHKVSAPLRHAMVCILGVALPVFVYLAVYLAPLYPFSALFFFAIGLPLHTFVPLIFVLLTGKYIFDLITKEKKYLYSLLAGVFIPILAVIIFTIQWNSINSIVSKNYQRSLIADNADLPAWIKVAQALPKNNITEKYLKSELVYSVPENTQHWSMFSIPQGSFDEVRKHDPLIMMAALFSKRPHISEEERIKILEAVYNSRHKTLDRLWSGDNLHTQYIISNIRIWPELRMAYTEKTLSVVNDLVTQWSDWNRQEAIYTFHLPEGAVVSSLSLWINDKEEKGILTTRGKADSAYKDIVGVQQRDPSVIHWQEGNTVSIRVFPVLPGEHRIFKIGVTAPLTKTGKQLRYEDIYFEGPGSDGADETVQIDWVTEPKDTNMDGFEKTGDQRYLRTRTYTPGWDISFSDPGLKPGSFSFDGNTYSINEYAPARHDADIKSIYLDLNNSWTKNELNEILSVAKGKNVYIFHNEMINITKGNNDNIINSLLNTTFSLFPFYEITDPQYSLVVTKGTLTAPNVKDLKGSAFARKLEDALSENTRYNVFHIGNDLSPYLKTLKEHRVFNYEHGSTVLLGQLLTDHTFAKNSEDSSNIVIDNAQIVLSKNAGTDQATAPDHLMRLFTYNYIMKQLGGKLFTNQESNTELVAAAEKAYIVTPISSLVVLENQSDYDKFDIKKSKNSLDNASLNNKGAVPEPHEWLLLLLIVAVLSWLLFKDRSMARFNK